MRDISYFEYSNVDTRWFDLGKIDLQPSFEKLKEMHGHEFGEKYWRRNYSRTVGHLNKIKLVKWIGRHVNDLVATYLPRLPEYAYSGQSDNRVSYLLYRVLDIEYVYRDQAGDLIVRPRRWGNGYEINYYLKRHKASFFYINPETGRICCKKFKRPVVGSKERARIIRENVEKKKAREAASRKRKKEREGFNDYWQYVMRKREIEDRKQDEIKIISHGFDPVTSFRNVPLNQ